MHLAALGEIGLIRRLSKGIKLDRSVVHGIGDDTAVLKYTNNKYQLFTCDMLLEDVHFTRKTATPFQIGWKALCRNISDIAAMGGIPRYALVSIAIDPKSDVKFIDGIYKGLKAAAEKFEVNIVGGDMAHSKKIAIDVSLIGEVEKSKLVTRSGAKVGDTIYITDPIGGSRKGKHLKFTPRIEEARVLVSKCKPTSMIDISDGLLLDLGRILDSSGVGAIIFEESVPISNAATSFDKAVTDGEDFELLFTASGKVAIKAYPIGRITKKTDGLRIARTNCTTERIEPKGYLHF